MRVTMPSPGAGLPQILDAIARIFIPVVSQNEATARIILLSPNGTSYEVTVDDTGALKTAPITPGSSMVTHGKARPR